MARSGRHSRATASGCRRHRRQARPGCSGAAILHLWPRCLWTAPMKAEVLQEVDTSTSGRAGDIPVPGPERGGGAVAGLAAGAGGRDGRWCDGQAADRARAAQCFSVARQGRPAIDHRLLGTSHPLVLQITAAYYGSTPHLSMSITARQLPFTALPSRRPQTACSRTGTAASRRRSSGHGGSSCGWHC